MKKLLVLFFMGLCIEMNAQQLQSPEQFLGYSVGSKYTPHHQIVNYCKAVAAAKSDMVKLEQYGVTNQGRPLLLLYVSTPANLQKLEEIKKNNLRLTGLLNDKPAATTDAPAIVWLSYNVHGNEPSSSEAALLSLYALVNPEQQQTKEWLKNTVVIIDPCLNPDGRDRYVNWFNSVAGKKANADPQSREHSEPWPNGRTNHYNFDLNRDWAWQTQIETQQRIIKYNEWMPQIHVDFHEQYYNNPYYFAPAAEPFHEVITPWQRSFQTEIGKNNARYFDEKGWLYFTKESFDLFYPSYGDTYPTYNGSIGMTYEQAGHSSGGLAVQRDEGDTLTLTDRAIHHYTTSMATIETASKNAAQLVIEFKKFFDDAINARGADYKTYVLTTSDANKMEAVKKILQLNGIQYGGISGNMKGFSYQTAKEEEVKLQPFTIAVSAYQPKSVLAKVLLEPQSKLVDTATYDITAWSIPYAYGVDAYALKDKKEIKYTASVTAAFPSDQPKIYYHANYGYLIPYRSFNAAKMLAYLLKNQVKVRISEKAFTYKNINYEAGTLIVLKTNNTPDWNDKINKASELFNIQPQVVETGFMDKGLDFGSPDIKYIKAPAIALLTGEGVSPMAAGEVWNLFEQHLDYPVSLINANELGWINLSKYNVLIIPDGYYRNLNDKSIAEKLREFVQAGGRMIAMENAVSTLAGNDWGIKTKEDKAAEKTDYALLKKYADRQREDLPNATPGAIYKVELDNTHPLAFGYGNTYYTLKQNAAVYEFLKEGWNVGVLKKENYVAGFAGHLAKNKLKDGTIFGVLGMGRGSIIMLADNPLFRMFWENGKLLFSNAVFVVGQ